MGDAGEADAFKIADQRGVTFGEFEAEGGVGFAPEEEGRQCEQRRGFIKHSGEIGAIIVDHRRERTGAAGVAAIMIDNFRREGGFVDCHAREGLADGLGTARAEQGFGEPGQLKKGDVPAFAFLRPTAAQHIAEHPWVGHVHDDQAIEHAWISQREDPGDDGAPIMRDEQAAPAACLARRAQRIEQRGGIGDKVVDMVIGLFQWPAGVAITPQIGRDGVPAQIGEERKLVAPRSAAFGKAVEAQCDVRPGAAFIGDEAEAVRSYGTGGDHCFKGLSCQPALA